MTAQLPQATRIVKHSLQLWSADTVTTFDRTGRFVRLVKGSQVVRRKLNGHLVRVTEVNRENHSRIYEAVAEEEANSIVEAVYKSLDTAAKPTDELAAEWLRRARAWTPETLKADGEKFSQAYLPVSILPPGEYQSVVVQITEGCSYNRCRFCDFYRNRPFHVKNETQLRGHLHQIRELFGLRLQDRTGFFLGDGNALVIAPNRLQSAMAVTVQELPEVPAQFSIFMDTFNMGNKLTEDLQELRRHGLETVYVGLESGYNPMRELLRKPGTGAQAAQSIVRLKEAGFRIGVMVMVGMGHGELAGQHLAHTREILESIPLDARDMIFVSPFVEPEDSPDWPQLKAELQSVVSYSQRLTEAQRWIHLLNRTLPAKVTLYSVLEHLY